MYFQIIYLNNPPNTWSLQCVIQTVQNIIGSHLLRRHAPQQQQPAPPAALWPDTDVFTVTAPQADNETMQKAPASIRTGHTHLSCVNYFIVYLLRTTLCLVSLFSRSHIMVILCLFVAIMCLCWIYLTRFVFIILGVPFVALCLFVVI